MANEHLRITPTSTGNRRVFTWSAWVKKGTSGIANPTLFSAGNNNFVIRMDDNSSSDRIEVYHFNGSTYDYRYITNLRNRDVSSWLNIVLISDTTASTSSDRIKLYINGDLVTDFGTRTDPSINFLSSVSNVNNHSIGANYAGGSPISYYVGNMADVFFVDGQALTPDVFGFYKQGKGYISVGSTQATDFRPGQWVPKTPRVIKTEINRRGGFGVNGFYLPMNDSRNFGADFHCDPNSIITLNEKLPQPRVGVATTASVGLGYTDALRADPYAANLVLALPFVSGGLSSGFGDYSHIIRNTGVAKTITVSNVSIASTASYYGSAAGQFTSSASPTSRYINVSSHPDFNMGTGDFTVETWVKLDSVSSGIGIWFSANQTQPTTYWQFGYKSTSFSGNNGPFVWYNASNIVTGSGQTTGQWDHVAWTRKGTVMTLWLNGVAVGINTNVTTSVDLNAGSNPQIGAYNANQDQYNLNGYLQDFRIYKGVAKYTSGFDVPRPYTPVGIATWRAVPDTIANNFATWTPNSGFIGRNSSNVRAGSVTLTDGNLTWYRQQNSIPIYSTINVRTGKWYWEYLIRGNTRTSYGIVQTPHDGGFGVEFGNSGDYAYMHEGGQTKIINGSSSSAGSYFASVPTVNDIVGVAFDANTGQLWFSKNGTFGNSGNPSSGTNALITGITTDTQYNFAVFGAGDYPSSDTLQGSTNFGQNPTFSGNTTAGTFTDSNGKGLFKYQPPSGFLALCEDNLPTPAISDPGKYFKTVLWTGDGNNGRSIVGVGFTPDLVWIKSRSPSAYNHRAFDSVRGAGKDNFLLPNSTAVEGASSDYFGGISSFNNDGFSMVYGTGGSNIGINESGTNFVAWCWRAGAGTTSTNTNGSIPSVVSVNQDAGFSIVSFRGNGSTGTVGHGLGRPPRMIIQKPRNAAASWAVYHASLGAGNAVWLNLTDASASYPTVWNSTAPTSSVYSVGSYMGTLDYIAYCWAEIEGFSKFGSYVGNGSADGPFVYCGFKPAFVLVKNASATVSWTIVDNARDSVNSSFNGILFPDLSAVENAGENKYYDFVSNGFKVRGSSSAINANGNTMIFAAFAESPFQTANSK